MLIHGRLILTAHGFNLDEVRSLIQKSLRRKEKTLVTQATKELLSYGKDQLPWKSLVTFLFEDHCLSGDDVIRAFMTSYRNGDKLSAVKLLFNCKTCRIAACLPVIALNAEYHPSLLLDRSVEASEKFKGLLTESNGDLNVSKLLTLMSNEWEKESVNEKKLICLFKLATIVQDNTSVKVTPKGEKYLLQRVKKPQPSHVFLSMLFQSNRPNMKSYIKGVFEISSIPDVCHRLLLSSILSHRLFYHRVPKNKEEMIKLNWADTTILSQMPPWAVDKHTFRGKCGKGTKHLLKKTPENMDEDQLEIFHGVRPKRDIKHFFDEGCQCQNTAQIENPYWEDTKRIYFERPRHLQKTIRMTAKYYEKLKTDCPSLMNNAKTSDCKEIKETADPKIQSRKRKIDEAFAKVVEKKAKSSIEEDVQGSNNDLNTQIDQEKLHEKVDKRKIAPEVHYSSLNLHGPLLQLPTGGGKLYTCVDLTRKIVIKGPYKPNKLSMTLFFHRAMKDILEDKHTMAVKTEEGKYLTFPLCMGKPSCCDVTKKNFYDAISKKNVLDGEFISRESLAVLQPHRLSPHELRKFPITFWAHFIFRAILNIGDSGLYNAITDKEQTFLYGIDMEEQRRAIKSNHILDIMFVKRPAAKMCTPIVDTIKQHKDDLIELLKLKSAASSKLSDLANDIGYKDFNVGIFDERLELACATIRQL